MDKIRFQSYNMYMFFGENLLSMRLEPIMSIDGVNVVGYELLSRPMLSNAEHFFCQLLDEDVWKLAVMQLSQTKVIQEKLNATGKKLFINLRGKNLFESYKLEQILKNAECKIALEIELKTPFLAQCGHEKNLQAVALKLQKSGHELWLDDYELNSNLLPEQLSKVNFQGVKIDKYSFWSACKTPHAANAAMNELNSVIPEIIIEGIENKKQKKIAASLGATYGQGYLWPFVRLSS